MKFRTKNTPPRLKGFNPWRVINPVSGLHKIPLSTRQGFNVILESPAKIDSKLGTAAQWLVKPNSDLIIYDGKSLDSYQREIFHFSQKYDIDSSVLPSCGNNDTICLGSISVTTANVPAEVEPIDSQLLMFLSRSNGESVCVIDPTDEYVLMFPHSKLKVIITDPLAESKREWSCEIDPYTDKLSLVSIGEGSQITPDLYRRVNPCLKSNTIITINQENKNTNSAKYFEFILDKDSAKKTSELKNGSFLLSRLIFTDGDNRRTVNVVLNVPKERKSYKSFPAFSKGEDSCEFDGNVDVAPSNPLCRLEERLNKLNTILNPSEGENIELTPSDTKVCIQVPLPKLLFPSRPDDSRWEISLDGNNAKINLTSQSDVTRWGHTFQSVLVDINPSHIPGSNSSGFVGALLMKIAACDSGPPINRRISVWFTEPFERKYSTSSSSNYSNSGYLGYRKSHEDRIVRTGISKRQEDYIKPAVCTDLKINRIEFKSLFDGITTFPINCATLITPTVTRTRREHHCHAPTYNPANLGGKVVEPTLTNGGKVFCDLADKSEIILPASSSAVIKMPFKENNGSLCCWAVRINDDRLIKITDLKTSITGNASGSMELTIEANLASAITGSAYGGTIVFSNGKETRCIKVRIVSANSKVFFPQIPFKSERVIEGKKTANYSHYKLIRAFQHNDSVVISPKDMIYVKIPTLIDNYTVSVDLVQNPLPSYVTLGYELNQKVNPACAWYLSGFPTIMNRAVFLRKMELNPLWSQIYRQIKDKNGNIHIADLVFRGMSNNTPVESSFGEVRQTVEVTKVLHILLSSGDVSSGKQILVPDPLDNTEIPVRPGDEIFIKLSPKKSSETSDWDWPWWYSGASNDLVEWIGLEKKERNYIMKLKAKVAPENSRTTVTFGWSDCAGENRHLNVHLVFKK